VSDVVVIGAGLGGLAASISLAARGVSVTLVEAGDGPGGKAGQATVDGVSFDTGPSVLTLPGLLRDLLAEAGIDLDDVLTLTRPEPAFRYLWPDGAQVRVHQQVEATTQAIREDLGADAAQDFEAFMAYSKGIWEAAAPYFVLASAPTLRNMAGLGLDGLAAVRRIDAFHTMQGALSARVRSPYLRDLFARFATYNGSDVRKAPATLHCIAHVEMGLGSLGVQGGIHRLPVALAEVAQDLGVQVRYGAPVEAIEVDGSAVCAVRLRGGERLGTRRVVANADVAHLALDLLPRRPRHGLDADSPRSTSGWTAVLRRRRDRVSAPDRVAHTAFFPQTYLDEFRDLFDHGRPPREPTVYVCDQALAHGRAGWDQADPVFVMANAPAEPARRPTDPQVFETLKATVRTRLEQAGLAHPSDAIVWERTPTGLAERFARSRGSLYGAASNSMFSAFQRPPNRLRRPAGLYLASGSAHPGGGMPLCLQSGRLAARALLDDLGVPA